MSNSVNEQSEDTKRIRPHSDNHIPGKNRKVALGAVVLIVALALVGTGIFYGIKSSVAFVKSYLGPDENTEYFEKYLAPVVMFNPKEFNDITQADQSWMVETAIWGAINENESNGTYATTSDGREILPSKDITNYFEKYFSKTGTPKYKTFTSGDFTYEYNSKEQCYYIPLVAVTDYVMPKVTKIQKNFNSVTLTVGYISSKNWGQDQNGKTTMPAPEKTVTVVLNGSRGNFSIKAIMENQTDNTASSSTATNNADLGTDSGASDSGDDPDVDAGTDTDSSADSTSSSTDSQSSSSSN